MSDRLEWRRIYGKPTAFVAGIAIGDCYKSKGVEEDDVWRVRVWNEDRVEGGRQQYVLPPDGEEPEDFAKRILLVMLERGRRDGD